MRLYEPNIRTMVKELGPKEQNKVLLVAERVRRETLDSLASKLINDEYCWGACRYWDEGREQCGLKNTECTKDDVEVAVRALIEKQRENEKIVNLG